MSLKYVQTLTLYQAGAGNIIGATSVVLTALTDIYGNAITSMTPFGAKGYITLEPDTTNEEGATFTGVTVNANGTVSLTGVSTILAQSPYTETNGLVRQHSGGTKVVVTDNVAFWNTFANVNNLNTFVVLPQSVATPTANSDFTTKTYVDGVAVAGASNANPTTKGIVQEATQAQVDARTTTGSTGAELFAPLDKIRSSQLSDYVASDTGSANAYAIAPTPVITAYAAGQTFTFKLANSNTGASTLAVSGLTAKTIKKYGSVDLVQNDILTGQIIEVMYDGTNFQLLSPVAVTATPTGTVVPFAGLSSPSGFLICDGSTVSRSTYSNLFSVIAPSFGTVTITIASPGVVTATAHGLQIGDQVYFTTTGALPTGLSVNTLYFIITAGFGVNSFEVSASRAGSVINTSGTQSGTHTMVKVPYGLGDGSTTFTLPDMRSNTPVGYKAADTNMGYYGQKGGEATHTLTIGEMPSHDHPAFDTSGNSSGGAGPVPNTAGASKTGTTGGGGAHNNLQPYVTLNFIIKT